MNKRVFDLNTHGILYLLANKRKLQIDAYVKGSYGAVELLIDLDSVLSEANLTERQQEIVDLYYFKNWTQSEIANHYNISQQAVVASLNWVKSKINTVLTDWGEI